MTKKLGKNFKDIFLANSRLIKAVLGMNILFKRAIPNKNLVFLEEKSLDDQRDNPTPTRSQNGVNSQWLQKGEMGRQRFWPKGTSKSLNVIQYR